jgi:hypothetical protein
MGIPILAAFLLGSGFCGAVNAQSLVEDAGTGTPIVRIDLNDGNVAVETAAQTNVDVAAPPSVEVNRNIFRGSASYEDTSIPIFSGSIPDPQGARVSLLPENFVVTTLPPGEVDVTTIGGTADPSETIRVTIPKSTSLLIVALGRGNVSVKKYREGTMIVRVRNGSIFLDNDGGDAFAQVMHGPLHAADSNFRRLRARTALGDILLERCTTHQVEVSSIRGSIIDDSGTFAPGLADFQSQHGDVAIGAAGSARVTGESIAGRVFNSFDSAVEVQTREKSTSAVIGDGGSIVHATSTTGYVFLYDGSLVQHSNLPEAWNGPQQIYYHLSSSNRMPNASDNSASLNAPRTDDHNQRHPYRQRHPYNQQHSSANLNADFR